MAKIFVGGLNWNTSDDAFKAFFASYGAIEDATIMRDREAGTSRGFGFVTFKDPSAVDAVLSAGDLELDGRKVDCKAAVPRDQIGKPAISTGLQTRTKKIFVGGLLPETTEQEFKEYFSQYGEVTEATIMMDRATSRSRGFGFITFDSENGADKVCANQQHVITGKNVECKKAVPKQAMPPGAMRGGRGGPMMGRGGFGGGRGFGFGAASGYPNPYGSYSGAAPAAYGPARGAGGRGGYSAPAASAYGYAPDPYAGMGGMSDPGLAAYGMAPQSAQPVAAASDPYGYEGYNPYAAQPAQGYGQQPGYGASAYGGAAAYEGQATMRSSKGDRAFHPYR